MVDTKHKPKANSPHSVYSLTEAYRSSDLGDTNEKFLNEYVFVDDKEGDAPVDGVWCYAVNLMRCFLLLADFKDAVAMGNGELLSILRKQLSVHFHSNPGFNEFSIEMFINSLQWQVFLTEADAHECEWVITVNWRGGSGKNVEIDLFQENRNGEMKKLIRAMGGNKTEKAISRASKAYGGVSKIVEAFQTQVNMHSKSLMHTHKSSADDESLISRDLRAIRPFQKKTGRMLTSFPDISCDPVKALDQKKFMEWVARHKRNILLHYPEDSDT